MHPLTYELMIEKGWRRCGTYYYKPDIKNSCCKLWTHRLDVNMFKIKKDQKKTVRNVAEWLMSKMEGKGTNKDK
jgi:arginine-tRNA-protein transferase